MRAYLKISGSRLPSQPVNIIQHCCSATPCADNEALHAFHVLFVSDRDLTSIFRM